MGIAYDREALRRIRLEKEKSVRELAYHTDMAEMTIYSYERGEVVPDADRLARLASALNARITEFFRTDKA
jgi:transcriptional regulator with XRE-family HTH domain